MKNIQKRAMALLVVLALVFSLLPPVALTADAATGNYVKNWGFRDEIAKELSDSAETYYGNVYATWSQLAGGTSTTDAPNSALYAALGSYMAEDHTVNSYSAAADLFAYTDCVREGSVISTFYSGTAHVPGESGLSREHTWPNSKSTSGSSDDTTREADIMMLRPVPTSENSGRGNKAYGESEGYYDPSKSGQNVRGDVARTMLYVYTRYGKDAENADGALDFMWGESGVIESLDILLKWMAEDPVDTWEMGRNDSVQSITGNRNVFVDYPELAFQLFGKSVPAGYTTPSKPVTGANVALTYYQNGTSAKSETVEIGSTVELAAYTGTAPTDYTFVGWLAEQVEDADVMPVVLQPGAEFAVTGYTNLFALYSFTKSYAGGTAYKATDLANIDADDAVVIVGTTSAGASYAMSNDQGTGKPSAVAVSVSDGILGGTPAANILWNIAKDGDNLTIYPAGQTAKWLYCTNSNTGAKVGTGENKVWVLDASGYLKNDGQTRYLGVYNAQDWRSYTSPDGVNIKDQTFAFFVESAAGDTTSTAYTTGTNVVVPDAPTPEQPPVTPDAPVTEVTELKTGDQVVIFAPAYNKALSATKTGNYNVGVDVTVANGTVTNYGDTEIFTVTANDDGTYSFANGGQNIGMAASYSSMNLGAENDKWELISLGGELYNVKNTVRGNYMEWYVQYSNWSTYGSSSAATDNQFQMSFYVLEKGILTAGSTTPDPTPDPDPEPEDPTPDEPVTPPATSGGSADLNTLGPVLSSGGNASYGTYNTTNGWELTNGAVQCGGVGNANPAFTVVGPDNSHKAACLNGKTSATGKLTSPTLTGGISKLTIDYARVFSDTSLSVTVTVTDAAGNTQTHEIANTTSAQHTKYTDEWTLETPVDGEFTIEVVNNCPSNLNSNKDRFTILNLEWVGTAAAPDPTPDPDPEPEGPTPDVPAVDYNTQLSRLPADGEYIVIVNSGMAMSKNASGNKMAAVAATVTDGVLAVTSDMAHLKVVAQGDKYALMLGDKYLVSTGTGNNLGLSATLDNYALWTIAATANNTFTLTSAGANFNGNYNQAMEYYSSKFTTYGIKDTDIYKMQLFLVEAPEEGDEPETPVVPAEPKPVTIPEAIEIGSAAADYTTEKYIVTGKILQVYGETYGNMYIQDDQGNILTIYGSYNADGSVRYDAMTEKPDAGDTVTLLGSLGNYSGKAQMKDGWIQSFTAGEAPNFTITAPENAETATITFDDVAKQTISAAQDQIVWTENGIVVTADKAESSTNANGAISPARFYKDYVLTIDGENMKMIEFNCGDIFYAQDLVKSIEALNDSNIESIQTALNVVAVTFVEPVETLQVTLLKQVRAYSFTIYATTESEPENLPTASDIFFAIDFGSSMTVNALIPMEVLDSFDSYSVKLSAEGREPVVLTSGGNYLDTYYEFAYANLTVLDVAKTVNVELTVTKGGQSYTTTDQKSILSFCETAIANSTSDAEPCAFLLQYAKAAAAYKGVEGVEVSAAAQSIIDGSSLKDALPGEAIRERENGQQISFLGQSLDMTARIAINFHIDLYNYAGDVNALTFDVNGKAYRFEDLEDDGDGIYVLSYSDFDATEMSKPAKCTVKVGGQVEAWYETSVERYCRGTLNNTENEATMIELAKCIYRYGAACAKAYGN